MISCLTNYIGLQDVTTSSDSGRYINELPGLSTTRFDEIRNTEDYDIDTSWANVERRAIRKFEQRLLRWADRYFRRLNLIETHVTGQVEQNITPTTGGSHYVGWLFKEFWSYSKSTLLNINWVQLYAGADVTNGTIYIFNASTGDTIDTILYNATGSQINQIPINKQYPFWKYPNIFVAYDDSEITTKKADELPWNPRYLSSITQGRFAKTSTILADNILQLDSNGQGLVMNYNVQCGLDNYVCQRLANFEEPYMYLLGAEFCNESIYSPRINQWTLLDRDKAIQLRDEFMDSWQEMIEGQLSTMTMDYFQDECFQCERQYNYVANMP